MKISYKCEEIIEELKKDIAEFGNIEMYAFFKFTKPKVPFVNDTVKYLILEDYDFISTEHPLTKEEINGSIVAKMKAEDILVILQEENKIF